MVRTAQATAILWLVIVSEAVAQTTTAPTTFDPAGGMNWLWLFIVAAVIAAAIWYFMRGRGPRSL